MKILALIFAFVLFLGNACAQQSKSQATGAPEVKDTYSLADAAVKRIFKVYRNYTRDIFTKVIDPELLAKQSFTNQVETNFYSGIITDLNFTVISAIQKGDWLSVKISWEKRTEPYNSPTAALSKGKTELIFHATTDWLLYEVYGDNPF